jgi:SPX domain protein involved in polyphosphate accumulation
MRYELKYNIELLQAKEISSVIKLHPAAFTKAYPDRYINNIYFDAADFLFYHDNVNGAPDRKKIRLRWYGDEPYHKSKCTLEIKNKQRQLGWKNSSNFSTDALSNLNELSTEINKLNKFPIELRPALQNRYKRSYYESHDRLFRITIDSQQAFATPSFNNTFLPTNKVYNTVMELKFEKEDWQYLEDITDFIPFRQTKNSKYVNGINAIYYI